MASKRLWEKRVWAYPLWHSFEFGFGLGMDDADTTRNATIVPYMFQDNALIDLETVKVNPENDDYAVTGRPNCYAGSYIPKCVVTWEAWVTSSQPDALKFQYLPIHTATLQRLDAFDKKTGTDIEALLELTHETTDEQVYPLWNGAKLYEGHHVIDYHTNVPGLTTTQQPEGVDFDIEQYFDARRYYTNKEMLDQVTGRMRTYQVPQIMQVGGNLSRATARFYETTVPSMCKYMLPYTSCMGLFNIEPSGSHGQPTIIGDTTSIEHLTVQGRVTFPEINPDFNFARA